MSPRDSRSRRSDNSRRWNGGCCGRRADRRLAPAPGLQWLLRPAPPRNRADGCGRTSLRSCSVRSRITEKSMALSAKCWAYSDKPSFSSHSPICCIATPRTYRRPNHASGQGDREYPKNPHNHTAGLVSPVRHVDYAPTPRSYPASTQWRDAGRYRTDLWGGCDNDRSPRLLRAGNGAAVEMICVRRNASHCAVDFENPAGVPTCSATNPAPVQ